MDEEKKPKSISKFNNAKKKYKYFLEHEQTLSESLKLKLEKVKSLVESGEEIYAASFKKDSNISEIKSKYSSLNPGDKVDKIYNIAGRVMTFRVHGKATFADLKDADEKIQLYINIKNAGEERYNDFLNLDVGDWIGVEGNVFVTHKGEISVNVNNFKLLSKSIRIMPEKWHGLKDVELRYRQRYLDFIVNPDVRKVFIVRIKVIKALRDFLNKQGFIEVETPMLQTIPGGAAAKPFITYHNALDIDLYLRIAPELYLKRLIIGGFEKVFELNRNFRNEGISHRHNPEFTMLEFYQAFVDYNDLMIFTEKLIKDIALKSIGNLSFTYKGNNIDLGTKWEKISMLDSIEKYAKVAVDFEMDIEKLRSIAKKLQIEIRNSFSKGKIINEIFEKVVAPDLICPTFIKDYPIDISPLARRHPENPNLTERFELFIGGEEIANAFSELIDPADQMERFKKQAVSEVEEERITGKVDFDFIKALEYGMPPTGGEGIGIDRLVMVLTDSRSVRDVILFPLMKPEKE